MARVDRMLDLAGRCHLNDAVRHFRLDRIERARPLGRAFSVPADFDLGLYLEGAWGVIRGEEEHPITLTVTPDLAPFVRRASLPPRGQRKCRSIRTLTFSLG